MKNIRLISAGAGTGKTFTLTDELSKKLSLDGYLPSQIIATTFTKAAAGELKSRTREKLLEENELELTAQIEQALIGTVNCISHQLLSLFSFESGLSPKLTVIDDEEKDVLFQNSLSQAVDVRTWNKIDELALRFSVWRDESKLVIKSISDFARNNAMDKKALESSRDDSISSLKKLLPKANEDQDKTQAKLKQLIPRLRGMTVSVGDTTGDTIKALKEFEDFMYRLVHHMQIPWADWADCAKQKCGAKSSTAGIFDEVQELMKKHIRFPGFQNDLIEYITLCFDAAITSMDAYDKMKKERGLVDFVDQESLLLKALDEPSIQKRFREQFKILFVDEFQDTSPLQLSLFLKISSLVNEVIWVGDSKQSIYGFRNSDAQLINTVTEALGKPVKDDILPKSYRSRPELVDIVNKVFVPAFADNNSVLTQEEISLTAERKKNPDLQTAFHLWGFQWKNPGKQYDSTEKYLGHVATRIAAFLDEGNMVEDKDSKSARKMKAGDIAVLCRTNHNCRAIANALRSQGLQAVVSDTGLNLTAEWRLLKACLHLLVDEADSLSKAELQFLTSEGHDVEAMLEDRLDHLIKNGNDYAGNKAWLADHPMIQWINENRNNLLSQSISGIIQLIYAGLDFHNIVMQWGDGAQRHANMQQVLTYANEFEDYCVKVALLPNVHGFISWFGALKDNEQDKRGLVTTEFSVNVLTYHAAKGLEWPAVILCDLDYHRDPDPYTVRVKAKGKIELEEPLKDRSLRFWPWPYKSSFGSRHGFEEFSECCKTSDDYRSLEEKEEMESLRLLYVGFTRARDYLVIPFKMHQQQNYLKQIAQGGIASIVDLGNVETDRIINGGKLFKQSIRLWVTNYSSLAEESGDKVKDVELYVQKNKKEYLPYYITPSGSKSAEDITFKEGEKIHSPFSDSRVTIERSDFGTFIHRVFCAYQPEMSDGEVRDIIRRLSACYNVQNSKMKEELKDRIVKFYRWIQSTKPINIYKELPLTMETNGQLIDGIADLVIETADEILLIDYKTFTGDDAAMQYKAQTFTGQLKLYMDILKKGFPGKKVKGGIYFVMKGEMRWVEELS